MTPERDIQQYRCLADESVDNILAWYFCGRGQSTNLDGRCSPKYI